MDTFEKKTLRTSRSFAYTYYTSSGDRSLPALVFQHGWPDHAAIWAEVASRLRSTEHPIIIPDMLGYDGTDKPTDVFAYKWDAMTRDIMEIVDTENYGRVIVIGHDWGSIAASALYRYYPTRVVGLVNLSVPYVAPSREPFDLEKMNQTTQQILGYRICEYWSLFTAEDGPELLKNNLDRLYNTMHGQGDTMKHFFTAPGAMREYLTKGGEKIQLRPYAQDAQFKKKFIDRMTRDGFEGPHCWYKAMKDNYQYECDKDLPNEVDVVKVPVLFVRGTEDVSGRPETMYPAIQAGHLPKLEQMEIADAAHWLPYEKPQETVASIAEWLKKHYNKE